MKRLLLWTLGIVMVLIAAILLAFALSPWPSVAIIAYAFSEGDTASELRLAKHVPPGVVTRQDLAYGSGPDEIFDISYPAGTTAPLPAIVWVHGGGWIAGSKDGVANYLKVLAGHGYAVVGLEYSTGYGSAYPKPVEQVNRALGYLQSHAADLNLDPGAIVLAGDSAGAQISGQVALLTVDPDYAVRLGIAPDLPASRLRGVMLLSGGFDLTSLALDGDNAWFLNTVLWAYSGVKNFTADERFMLASVTTHASAAFPATFISSGNGDPLEPQAVALATKLQGLGVAVDSLFFPADYSPALPHEYQFNLDTPAGQESLDRMLAFMARVLGR